MAAVNAVSCISPHKNILQQTNNNVPIPEDKKDNQKQLERNIVILRKKRKASSSPENENRMESEPTPETKNEKSDVIKLRSVRLVDISSQKLGVIRNVTTETTSSKTDDSSDDDFKKKSSKPRPIVPNYVTNADKGPYRKPRQYKRDELVVSSQTLKVAKPQSLSIARRNARERNRVKQVNQGFATLRGRIPDYISEVYNEEKGRKNTKKLSKVETLRMAVDYIRHLETMLDFKSDESTQWLAQVKTENLSWNTSNSSNGYPSPVDTEYQQSCIESPSTPYDQSEYSYAIRYPERPFYDYDFELTKDLMPLKPGKTDVLLPAGKISLILNVEDDFVVSERCYDKFELFDKIKKEDYAEYPEPCDEDEKEEETLDKFESDVEIDLSKKSVKETDRSDENNSPLPSISETFPNRNLSAFYDSRSFGT